MRFFAALLLVLWAAPSLAQFETATVVGTVRDTSGAVVPSAKVTLTNRATGVSVERMSDGNGSFEFFTVRIGIYLVSAEKDGFSIAVIDDVQVTVGARQRVDLSMAVGSGIRDPNPQSLIVTSNPETSTTRTPPSTTPRG